MTGSRSIRITAAVPSKRILAVATLSWNGHHLYLVSSITTFFTLASDDQLGVRRVANEIWDYFNQLPVAGILVRRGPEVGPRQASTGSTKFETILQLMPFTCAHVHVQKVTGWANQRDWRPPLPQSGLQVAHRDLQGLAIQTAAFGVACALTDGFWPTSDNG